MAISPMVGLERRSYHLPVNQDRDVGSGEFIRAHNAGIRMEHCIQHRGGLLWVNFHGNVFIHPILERSHANHRTQMPFLLVVDRHPTRTLAVDFGNNHGNAIIGLIDDLHRGTVSSRRDRLCPRYHRGRVYLCSRSAGCQDQQEDDTPNHPEMTDRFLLIAGHPFLLEPQSG